MPDSSTYPLPPKHSSASAACDRRPLAHPVLRHRQPEPPERLLLRVTAAGRPPPASRIATVVAASDSTTRSASTLRHQRLVDQRACRTRAGASRGAPRCTAPSRMPDALPEHAVQPGVVDHLDDRADPAALLADQPADRVVVLDLGRRVRPVAQLVLQPLQPDRVARAVGQDAGEQEARQPAGRLGQRQEHVRHRRRGEPLVPDEGVAAVGAAASPSSCWRGRRSRPASPSSTCPRSGRACSLGSRSPKSYSVAASSGSYRAASSGLARSAGTAAYVIEIGQLCPASTWPQT